jgi:CubicO group peptidase (beta-lactamase class C family)
VSALLDPVRGFVEDGRYPGIAALVWREGREPAFGAIGLRDRERRLPFARDTIFRLASMTKPIATAAAMVLVERGVLCLDAPLSRWLPEAGRLRVLRTPTSELNDVVPLERPPTLFDLMTHTAGFAWGKGLDLPICRAMDEATGTTPFVPHDADSLVRRVCALPLICQPGKRWHYSNGSDLLGVIVARASGMALAEFLRMAVLDPIGMRDTAFFVPRDKLDRFAAGYERDGAGGFRLHDAPATGFWSRSPIFPAGGGGLVSTLDDYLAFARMLLSGGLAGHGRVLSEESIGLMTGNRLSPAQLRPLFPQVDFLHGQGFGLGLSVALTAGRGRRSVGSFAWPGGYGTTWFADPRRRLAAILATQVWQDHLTELAPAFEAGVVEAD